MSRNILLIISLIGFLLGAMAVNQGVILEAEVYNPNNWRCFQFYSTEIFLNAWRLNVGVDESFIQNYHAAKERGIKVIDAYLMLSPKEGESPAFVIDTVLAYIKSKNLEIHNIWLAVVGGLWSSNQQNNLYQLVDGVRRVSASRLGVGIFSVNYYWSEVIGNQWDPVLLSAKVWYSSENNQTNFHDWTNAPGQKFGKWELPTMKNYKRVRDCESPVSLNWRP